MMQEGSLSSCCVNMQAVSLMQNNSPAWLAAIASLAQLHVSRRGPVLYLDLIDRCAVRTKWFEGHNIC